MREGGAAGTVGYVLDGRLRVVDAFGHSGFIKRMCEKRESQGRQFEFDDAYEASLLAQVRYHDSRGWSKEPPDLRGR